MYSHVCIAGTFDQLHIGHTAFLKEAFAHGSFVTIGITSDEFVKKYKKNVVGIRPFSERRYHMLLWLAAHRFEHQSAIVSIDDPYQPAASDPSLQALLVTDDNKKTGDAINVRRLERNLSPLELIVVPLVNAPDGIPVASTRVRIGEIHASGDLVMPETLRSILSQPFGEVYKNEAVSELLKKLHGTDVLCIGDKTADVVLKSGNAPLLVIVDGMVERETYAKDWQNSVELTSYKKLFIKSGPGFISHEAFASLTNWVKEKAPTVMIIDGEDDLLTLPAILAAPIGSVVLYGQPKEGMVVVAVTDETKLKARDFLRSFTKRI